MSEKVVQCAVVADFNASNLAGRLRGDETAPRIMPMMSPYGQVAGTLAGDGWDGWAAQPDAAIVWTRPEAVSHAFKTSLEAGEGPIDAALAEVDAFAGQLSLASARVKHLLVPTWVMTQPERRFGVAAVGDGQPCSLLMRMNLRLAEQVRALPAVQVVDAQRWLIAGGRRAFDPRLWYLAKIPFGHDVFRAAASDFKAAIRAAGTAARKLLIVDLDDTLWGGIVGDEGWQRIRLGGHDHVGEAHADFQRALKALANRGVLLAIVSKNDERVALDAVANHPEMVLRPGDFAGWRVNWEDKARNIVELVAELNLGLDSVVFIDDNPVERARVRESLPEVFVPEWPGSCVFYTSALWSLDCFDTVAVTAEDRARSQLYAAESRRMRERQLVGSPGEWLKSLRQKVTVTGLTAADVPRATQLLNKTNQMNLSCRRMTASELEAWARHPQRTVWTIRVSDKFGDAGLTGLLSVEVAQASGRVVDFVLSCRVMGRHIEETMLSIAARHAREAGVRQMRLEYVPNERNAPCLQFLRRSGLREADGATFLWTPEMSCDVPDGVDLVEPVASR